MALTDVSDLSNAVDLASITTNDASNEDKTQLAQSLKVEMPPDQTLTSLPLETLANTLQTQVNPASLPLHTELISAQPQSSASAQPPAFEAVSLPWPQRHLPTSTLHVLDYRLLIVRAQGRLNIEHQLTGETASLWPAQQRIQGDWLPQHCEHTGFTQLQGTPFWLQWTAQPHHCVLYVPEHGLHMQLNCGLA